MPRIDVSRVVAADPSSVALVLAGPAASELWPAGRGLAVSVVPPARDGLGFSATVTVAAGDLTVADGRLAIVPRPGGGPGCSRCEVRLDLHSVGAQTARVERDAARYLDALAEVGRERSTAA